MSENKEVLRVIGLRKAYKVKAGPFKSKKIQALNDVSLSISKGKTLAVIGESGCGKTTLAKQILGIEFPDSGTIQINGETFTGKSRRGKDMVKKVQLVFQNPYASLNPRQSIGSFLQDPLILHTDLDRADRMKKVSWILEKTGLQGENAARYPHMFSGGQRQRIAIARALILNPELLILDEPVSALDLSIQAQILNLLKDLQRDFALTYLFITHNISIIRFFSDEVMVMYLGKCVEYGPTEKVLDDPQHPYTKILLSSSCNVFREGGRRRIRPQGEIPSPLNLPSGCLFQTRCPLKTEICGQSFPPLQEKDGQGVFCHHPGGGLE